MEYATASETHGEAIAKEGNLYLEQPPEKLQIRKCQVLEHGNKIKGLKTKRLIKSLYIDQLSSN